MREIDMIVIHCSATRCDRDYTFKSLDNDHRSRGWNGCGYHRYITKDGTVHIGRPYEQVGAHVGPKFNPHSIGICYEGGLNAKGQFDDTRTEAQKRSMAKLIRDLKARFPKARILGHRDLPGVHKACPCYNVAKDQIRDRPFLKSDGKPRIRDRPTAGVGVSIGFPGQAVTRSGATRPETRTDQTRSRDEPPDNQGRAEA